MAYIQTLLPFANQPLSAEEVERQRKIEDLLAAQGADFSPVGSWTQGAARVANALAGAFRRGRLERSEKANAATNADLVSALVGGGSEQFPAAPSNANTTATDYPSQRVASAFGDQPGPANSYFDAIRSAESGGSDTAKNPLSSATGRYQFTKGTWDGLMTAHPELDLTPDGRTDPEQQERAIRVFTQQNAAQLQDAGIQPTGGNLYAAHFLGADGAKNVLTQPDNAAVSSFVGPEVVKANPFLKGMTVGQFKQWAASKGGGNDPIAFSGTVPADSSIAMSGPPTVPPLSAPVDVPDRSIQVAQAAPTQMSDADALQALGARAYSPQQASRAAIIKALTSPAANSQTQAVAAALLKQQLDPNAALDAEYKRAQIDYYKRRGGSLINAGNGNIYDPQTGSWISAPAPDGDAPLFDGKSVQAQGLNYLVRTGELTKDQAAQLAAGKTITDPSTGAITFMTPQGLVTQPGDGAAGGGNAQSGGNAPNGGITLTAPKKPTDTEYVTGTYADRMANSGKIIDKLENAGTSYIEKGLNSIPFGLGNYAISDDYQMFDQAERDFINAVLRRESGAVINPDEFENGKKQYFPQPGDSEAVIEQKRRNRQIAIQGMRRAAGPSYAAGQGNQPQATPAAPKIRRYNPQTGELE